MRKATRAFQQSAPQGVLCTALILACACTSLAQYRGGSIHWEPVAPGSRTVRFTLRTAWERTAGVYTKIVDGVPQRHAGGGMYQPAKGDRVRVLGPETPKLIVSNGLFREYLELTVTHNSEQVLRGGIPGQNQPHQYEKDPLSDSAQTHWSYEGTNFFEGISQWEVEIPDPTKTYVAEFQGCCRVSKMAPMQNNQGCIEARYGRGVLQLCETAYFLRSTVNLQHVPPPLSFLPQILPYTFLDANALFEQPLELPILDFRATAKGMTKLPPQELQWPEKIAQDEVEAHGNLYEPAAIVVNQNDLPRDEADNNQASARVAQSRFSGQSPSSRHLMADHAEQVEIDLEPLPQFPKPPPNQMQVQEDVYQVFATAALTGVSVRMLDLESKDHVTLYSATACKGYHQKIPPGSDICESSFVDMHDCNNGQARYPDKRCFQSSSVPVLGKVTSILVPPGLVIDMTDSCEISEPYNLDQATILETCDNRMGDTGMCCNVTSSHVRTFRATQPSAAKQCAQQDNSCPDNLESSKHIHEALRVEYGEASKEGVVSTLLRRPRTPSDLTKGNYPVTLMMGTRSSGLTMVEFVLKVLTKVGESTIRPFIGGREYDKYDLDTVDIPTNFRYSFTWQFTGPLSLSGNIYFQTIDDAGYTFGDGPMVVNYPLDTRDESTVADDVPANGKFTWTPCEASAGLYYYCASAVSIPAQDFSEAMYEWAQLICVKMRVVEDLPPRVTFYRAETPYQDQSKFEVTMGKSLEAVVNASDNFQDSINFLSISKFSMNTGDELRARVTYVYENVDKAYGTASVAKMPKIVEPAPPSFINLYIGGPLNETLTRIRSPYQRDKIVSFTPTRMHSGLELTVCFIAVDSRGSCSKLGDWTERCMSISVQRCKYSMRVGEDFQHVAGLFEMNWIQLFALNPTHISPESGVKNHDTVINVGHLYNISEGENAYDLMRRFGSTKKHLMFANVDLSRQNEEDWARYLPVGMQVCVLPDSCGTQV